jgi:membrane-bound inhibitor of C-type lysozyme
MGFGADVPFTRTYRCGSFGKIVARYDNSGADRATVRLTVGGASRDLVQVVAASGARYATEHGLNPDHSLIWWTSGPEATLLEMPLDHTATLEDARILATCRLGP